MKNIHVGTRSLLDGIGVRGKLFNPTNNPKNQDLAFFRTKRVSAIIGRFVLNARRAVIPNELSRIEKKSWCFS